MHTLSVICSKFARLKLNVETRGKICKRKFDRVKGEPSSYKDDLSLGIINFSSVIKSSNMRGRSKGMRGGW